MPSHVNRKKTAAKVESFANNVTPTPLRWCPTKRLMGVVCTIYQRPAPISTRKNRGRGALLPGPLTEKGMWSNTFRPQETPAHVDSVTRTLYFGSSNLLPLQDSPQ